MGKQRTQRKLRASVWPKGLSDEKLAEFVSTYDLSKVVGTGKPIKVEFAPEVLDRTQEKRIERMLVALRMTRLGPHIVS